MGFIKDFVYCSQEQFDDLVKYGKAIINGVEKPYEPDTTFYITPSIGNYPVGAIYLSIDNTSPASLLGGTWERISNVFLYGATSKNAGERGGYRFITIEEKNLPAGKLVTTINNKSETVQIVNVSTYNTALSGKTLLVRQNELDKLGYELSSAEDANIDYGTYYDTPEDIEIMPPYLAVNMWKRVA